MSQFHTKRLELFSKNGIENTFLAREAYCYEKVCGASDDEIVKSLKKRGF